MDQNPLPRGSLQICERLGQQPGVVPELAEAADAVEAQYPVHPAGAMIVVQVLRVLDTTDGAAAALGRRQLVELRLCWP